jgi:hypothetical protein
MSLYTTYERTGVDMRSFLEGIVLQTDHLSQERTMQVQMFRTADW